MKRKEIEVPEKYRKHKIISKIWAEAYNRGRSDGYDDGETYGYEKGYDEGYDESQSDFKEELDQEWNKGYEYGKCEGMNSLGVEKDEVLKKVDYLKWVSRVSPYYKYLISQKWEER